MKPKRIVDLQNFFGPDAQTRTGARVVIVAKGNDCVETVVTAGHLQHDQNRAIASGGDLRGFIGGASLKRGKCVSQKGWDRPGDRRAESGGVEEFATSFKREIG